MSLLQAAACLVLWRSGRFDTLDIANVIDATEPDVVKLIDAVRNRERGPDLCIVGVSS